MLLPNKRFLIYSTAHQINLPPPLCQQIDLQKYSTKLSQNAQFVAIKSADEEIVALIAYYVNHQGKFIYLTHVWVDRNHWGKGYATTLINHLHEKYAAQGFQTSGLEVAKSNTRALGLYTFLGYREKEDRNIKIYMTKDLNPM